MSDCCLAPTQQFFSYILEWTSYISMRWWWYSFSTRPKCLAGFLKVLSDWSNSDRVDTSLTTDTLFWFLAIQSLLELPNANVYIGEPRNATFVIFSLTLLALKPTIHYNRSKHANHFTTDDGRWRGQTTWFLCIDHVTLGTYYHNRYHEAVHDLKNKLLFSNFKSY